MIDYWQETIGKLLAEARLTPRQSLRFAYLCVLDSSKLKCDSNGNQASNRTIRDALEVLHNWLELSEPLTLNAPRIADAGLLSALQDVFEAEDSSRAQRHIIFSMFAIFHAFENESKVGEETIDAVCGAAQAIGDEIVWKKVNENRPLAILHLAKITRDTCVTSPEIQSVIATQKILLQQIQRSC